MTNCVYWVTGDIELDLRMPDLGHPDRPGLWSLLYRQQVKDLQCPECREDRPDCPEWMYLQIRNGKRVAVHKNNRIGDHPARETDLHKALKERIATAAESGGFEALIESAGAGRKRVTDVLVKGSDGFLLGCEAQVAYATVDNVRKRSDIARADGLTPLWATNDRKANLIDQTPWARIDNHSEWRRINDPAETLPVRGGVRNLRWERCIAATKCNDKRCGGWHAVWDVVQLPFNDLITRAASQTYTPLHVRSKGRAADRWFWVPAEQRDLYWDNVGRPEAPADVKPAAGVLGDVLNVGELKRECTYGVDSGVRAVPSPVRDVGGSTLAFSASEPLTGLRPSVPPTRRPVRRGVCGAGTGPCGAERARLYQCGWRCDLHKPGGGV